MDPKPKAVSSNTPKKKKQLTPAKKFVFTVSKILIVFFIALSFAIIGVIGGAIFGYIKTTPELTDEQIQLSNFTSFVYDSKGKEIGQLRGDQNRIWVYDKDIPVNLKNAFVAIEDERFYSHSGIDLKRIAGAVINLFTPNSKIYGASTITQQVVKNLTGEKQQTLQRKVQEQWRAVQLEKKLAKWQILELYMNLIYMGENCYGVQSAAKVYFNKDVKDLTLAESACLAGITNSPAYYDPLTTKGRDNNKKRQELILKKMVELGFISQKECDQALDEELVFNAGDKTAIKVTSSQSYFVDQVVMDVKKELMAQGMSEQIALKTIYNNGLKIYTTMDSDVQQAMDSVFKDDKFFPVVNKNLEHPQAAMAIVDPKTGHVRAMYGGYGEKKGNTLNRATQAKRQPGSSFKPIAVYGPAVDQKLITPATVVDDVPVYMNGFDKPKYPENYESGSFRGLTTIHDSIRDSINVVAAKVWRDMLGPDKSLAYLKKVGINRDKERYVSIAMGGLNEGVSPLEMAAAYVPFVNKGMFFEPTTYTKVEDKNGKVILQKKQKTTIVYDEASAYVMTEMMQDVPRIGTAYPYGLIQNGNMPTAGKTGTTSDFKDKWFLGFSPYYIGATWYGYDKPSKLQPAEYNQALVIWHEVMERAHKNLPPVEFPEPAGIVRKTICIYSGKIATDLCSRDPRGNAVRPGEVFVKGTEPKDNDFCDVHVLAKVCKDSTADSSGRNRLFTQFCPPGSVLEQVFVHRKEKFVPAKQGDPYPLDWEYELPEGELCDVHTGTSSIKPEASPSKDSQKNPASSTSPIPPAKDAQKDNAAKNPAVDNNAKDAVKIQNTAAPKETPKPTPIPNH